MSALTDMGREQHVLAEIYRYVPEFMGWHPVDRKNKTTEFLQEVMTWLIRYQARADQSLLEAYPPRVSLETYLEHLGAHTLRINNLFEQISVLDELLRKAGRPISDDLLWLRIAGAIAIARFTKDEIDHFPL